MLIRSRLVQDVVRQIVILIHRQIPVQHARRSPAPVASTSSRSPLPFVPGRICCRCCVRERPVPEEMRFVRIAARLPSSHRFSLYSRLILSSDTGMYRSSAPRIARRSRAGTSAGTAAPAGPPDKSGTRRTTRPRPRPKAPPSRAAGVISRQEPDRQRARVRARLVRIVGEVLDRGSAVPRPDSDRIRDGPSRRSRAISRKYGLSSKLRPAKRNRKRLQPPRRLRRRVVQDRRRIQPARCPHAQRNVRNQVLAHRFPQQPVQFLLRRPERCFGVAPLRSASTTASMRNRPARAIPANARAAPSGFPRSASASPGT